MALIPWTEISLEDIYRNNHLFKLLDKLFMKNSEILDKTYPVGSIYMSVNNNNPSELFGGTWEQIQGKFLLASSNSHPLGEQKGEETHTLTVNEIPSHTHVQNAHKHSADTNYFVTSNSNLSTGDAKRVATANTGGNYYVQSTDKPTITRNQYTKEATATNQNTGGGQAHNNMPPYLAVNVWKRTG